jgi:hypothetical protein
MLRYSTKMAIGVDSAQEGIMTAFRDQRSLPRRLARGRSNDAVTSCRSAKVSPWLGGGRRAAGGWVRRSANPFLKDEDSAMRRPGLVL